MTPDSQKSTMDKMKETVTDATDRLTGSAQGDSQKSYSQQAYDSIRGGADNQTHGSSTETMYVPPVWRKLTWQGANLLQ